MKRWKAFTGAALAAALVFAPLVSTGASAAESTPVGVDRRAPALDEDTNNESYWENRYAAHNATCYDAEREHQPRQRHRGGKTVTLKPFDQDWPGDHWELLVVKAGNLWNNVIVHPTAGVAYASPLNGGGQQGAVSHWIVCKGTTPTPTVVTPKPPVVKDLCETADDHDGPPGATTAFRTPAPARTSSRRRPPATSAPCPRLEPERRQDGDVRVQRDAVHQEVNCEEIIPVPAVFLATPVPPTCQNDGALPSLGEHPNVTLTWNRRVQRPRRLHADGHRQRRIRVRPRRDRQDAGLHGRREALSGRRGACTSGAELVCAR